MFPDSSIACKFSSAKTKTEAVINNVLGPHTLEVIKSDLKAVDYVSISTDASNHRYHKIFPIVIQYFSVKSGIESKLIELDELPNETSDTVSSYIIKVVKMFHLENKVIAFSGDNTNTNFGGVNRREGNNIFTKLKTGLNNPNMIGIGCPAHILHNTIQTAADRLTIDVECMVVKIFNYFSIYTVRVNELMSFCEFVNVTFQDLLNHSKTRWLSLLPAVERLISLFDALKSYFLSQDKCPKAIKSFFDHPLAKAYLLFVKSQMKVFQTSILKIEAADISIIEVSNILNDTLQKMNERRDISFKTIDVQAEITASDLDNSDRVLHTFNKDVDEFYLACTQYLDKWLKSFDDVSVFTPMTLITVPKWEEFEAICSFLKGRQIVIDDNMLFDQFSALKNFVAMRLSDNKDEWHKHPSQMKWKHFFQNSLSTEQTTELLKIAQFYFSIPGHNANVERIFSLMNCQWTDERNRLLISSVRSILLVQYNFKHVNCSEFYDYVKSNSKLLAGISSSLKYDWAKKGDEASQPEDRPMESE